jgi:hypothetical protein
MSHLSTAELDALIEQCAVGTGILARFCPTGEPSAVYTWEGTVTKLIMARVASGTARRLVRVEWTTHAGDDTPGSVTGSFPQDDTMYYIDVTTSTPTGDGVVRRRYTPGNIPGRPSRPGSPAPAQRLGSPPPILPTAPSAVVGVDDPPRSVENTLQRLQTLAVGTPAPPDRPRDQPLAADSGLLRFDALEHHLADVRQTIANAPSAADIDEAVVRLESNFDRRFEDFNRGVVLDINRNREELRVMSAAITQALERVVIRLAGLEERLATAQTTAPAPAAQPAIPASTRPIVIHDVATWPSPLDAFELKKCTDRIYDEMCRELSGKFRETALDSLRELKKFLVTLSSFPEWQKNLHQINAANRLIFTIKACKAEADGKATIVELLKRYDEKYPSPSADDDEFFVACVASAPPASKGGSPTTRRGKAPAAAPAASPAKAPSHAPAKSQGGVAGAAVQH